MEGIDHLERLGAGWDDIALARKKFEEAIALDPQWSVPYHLLSNIYLGSLRFGADPHESLKNAYEYAQKAISLDEADVGAYLALVQVYAFQRRYEEALAAGERVVKVAPGSPYSYICLGRALLFAGRYKEALVNLERALRMNPSPQLAYLMDLGIAHAFLRNYEEAVSFFKKALSITPNNLYVKSVLVVIYVEMGRLEEARAEAKELLIIDPKWNPQEFLRRAPWKDPQYYERWTEAFRKVGLLDEVSKN
jgi:adenylate cyclase